MKNVLENRPLGFALTHQPPRPAIQFGPRIAILGFLASCVILGCEPVPQPVAIADVESGRFGLVDETSGRFDWPLSRSGFSVARPPIYASLSDLASQPLLEMDQSDPPSRPVLDDEQWVQFCWSIGTNPETPFQMKPIGLRIAEIDVDGDSIAIAMSADGTIVYVANHERVDAWQLGNAWRTQFEWVTNEPSQALERIWTRPLSGTDRGSAVLLALAGGPASPLLVVNGNSAWRIESESGILESRLKDHSQPFRSVGAALGADAFYAVDEEGSVLYMDAERSRWSDLNAPVKVPNASQVPPIGIQPDGLGFVSFIGNQPVTVWVEDGRQVGMSRSETLVDREPATATWTERGRFWSDGNRIYSITGPREIGDESTIKKLAPMTWRPVEMRPEAGNDPTNPPFQLVMGLRRDDDGEAVWSLWDMESSRGENSLPTELFTDQELAASAFGDSKRPVWSSNPSGSKIAYLDPTASQPRVAVLFRNPWERADNSGAKNYYWRILDAEEDRTDEFDQVAGSLLASTQDLPWGRPVQEHLHKYLITQLVSIWSDQEKRRDWHKQRLEDLDQIRTDGIAAHPEIGPRVSGDDLDAENWDAARYEARVKELRSVQSIIRGRLDRLEGWLARGSDIAKVCAAGKHVQAGWRHRGSGWGYQVSQEGGRKFAFHLGEAARLCQELMEHPHPIMSTFYYYFISAKGTDVDRMDIEPQVRRFLQLHAECPSPHTALCDWLMPKWGGMIGDTASYLRYGMDMVDPSIRESVFGITSIQLADNNRSTRNYFLYTGVSEKRALRGAAGYLDQGQPNNPYWVSGLIWVAAYCNNSEVVTKANHYFRSHFLYGSGDAYRQFPRIFAESFEDRPEPR